MQPHSGPGVFVLLAFCTPAGVLAGFHQAPDSNHALQLSPAHRSEPNIVSLLLFCDTHSVNPWTAKSSCLPI